MAEFVGGGSSTVTTRYANVRGDFFEFSVCAEDRTHVDSDNTKRLSSFEVTWRLVGLTLGLMHNPDKTVYRCFRDSSKESLQPEELPKSLSKDEKHKLHQAFREIIECCAGKPDEAGLVTAWALRIVRDAGINPIK